MKLSFFLRVFPNAISFSVFGYKQVIYYSVTPLNMHNESQEFGNFVASKVPCIVHQDL